MKKAVTLIVPLLFLLAGAGFAEPAPNGDKPLSVHSYHFRFRDADKAAAMIKSLISADGSMSIQPGSNTLIVTDRAENLKSIDAALQQFDKPAQNFRLYVRVISAGKVDPSQARISEDLKDIAPKLALLRYNSYESLGHADISGAEGDPAGVELQNGYRADFKFGEFDPAADTLQISDFRLSRQQGDQLTPLLKTTLNLKLGNTVIMGASRAPQSQRAVMIVVVARR
jgi:hypothetical protein